MQTHSIFVFTHDSIALGEDGPTHQPIEHLMMLRAVPHLTDFRPADANETAAAWRLALERKSPRSWRLSRQDLPVLDPEKHEHLRRRKAWRLHRRAGRRIAGPVDRGDRRGSVAGAESGGGTQGGGITARVVSMPSWKIFEEQPAEYKASIFPDHLPKLAVEAGGHSGLVEVRGPARGRDWPGPLRRFLSGADRAGEAGLQRRQRGGEGEEPGPERSRPGGKVTAAVSARGGLATSPIDEGAGGMTAGHRVRERTFSKELQRMNRNESTEVSGNGYDRGKSFPRTCAQILAGRCAEAGPNRCRHLRRVRRSDQTQAAAGALPSGAGRAAAGGVFHCRRGAPSAGGLLCGGHEGRHSEVRRSEGRRRAPRAVHRQGEVPRDELR